MTRMNIFNATAVVPTLARLVLCLAFLTMGWNKLMYTHEFTGEAAQTLINLGVVDAGDHNVVPASLPLSDETIETDAEPVLEDETETEDRTIELPDIPEPPDDVLRADPITGEQIVEAKRLHTVTVAVANAGWAQPVTMAWIAALTELLGGALLLIGLFSRVWGLGLAITMGVAFYMTSLPGLMESGVFAVAADMTGGYAAYNRMYVQLALGVLALGVFLTGPGPLSLDRLLFRSNHPRDHELDDMP